MEFFVKFVLVISLFLSSVLGVEIIEVEQSMFGHGDGKIKSTVLNLKPWVFNVKKIYIPWWMGNTECSLKLYLDLVMLQGFNNLKNREPDVLLNSQYGVGEEGGGMGFNLFCLLLQTFKTCTMYHLKQI